MTTTQLRNLMIFRLRDAGLFSAEEIAAVFSLRAEQVHRVCRDMRNRQRKTDDKALARARASVEREIAARTTPLTPDRVQELVKAGKVHVSPAWRGVDSGARPRSEEGGP